MLDLMALPIPDWGLHCPSCGAALAGLEDHRCGACGRRFELLKVLALHRPIPDLGLTCPSCEYSLTGLEESRCPECGEPFELADMLADLRDVEPPPSPDEQTASTDPPDHQIARREPTFTGRERPLPDFGLACGKCGADLTGSMGNACLKCGEPFELDELDTLDEWVDVFAFVRPEVVPAARSILYASQVPYLAPTSPLEGLHMGMVVYPKLMVPREFFYDALHVLASGRPMAPATGDDAQNWACPTCGEVVPGHFEVCWNCQTPHSEAEEN
jgi:predicted amidophosphoribosyltransferase